MGLALAGLLLSLLLEVLHVRAYLSPDSSSFCSAGTTLDCTSVALSRYAVLLGLPLPVWGALGFFSIGTAAWLRSAWLVPLTALAAAASVALLGIELVLVGALCLLCEGVHLLAVALLVIAWRGRASLAPRARDDGALIFLPALGLMLGLLLFLNPYWRVFTWKGALPLPEGVTSDGAAWVGAREPKLVLEEYTDYLCPHCKAATSWTLRRLAQRPNDIRIVRRQHPLRACRATLKGSCPQLRMAYCAAEQQRFWQMDRWLFAHDDQVEPSYAQAAADVGLDGARFERCVERPDVYERAEREAQATTKRHFKGTPTYMVGGKRIPSETADRLLEQGRPD